MEGRIKNGKIKAVELKAAGFKQQDLSSQGNHIECLHIIHRKHRWPYE